MKHAIVGLTLAVMASMSAVAHADEGAPPAGSIEKASDLAVGDVSTVIAVGLGVGTAIAVVVIGAEGGGGTATATSTAQ